VDAAGHGIFRDALGWREIAADKVIAAVTWRRDDQTAAMFGVRRRT
jgi:hypothetical protein